MSRSAWLALAVVGGAVALLVLGTRKANAAAPMKAPTPAPPAERQGELSTLYDDGKAVLKEFAADTGLDFLWNMEPEPEKRAAYWAAWRGQVLAVAPQAIQDVQQTGAELQAAVDDWKRNGGEERARVAVSLAIRFNAQLIFAWNMYGADHPALQKHAFTEASVPLHLYDPADLDSLPTNIIAPAWKTPEWLVQSAKWLSGYGAADAVYAGAKAVWKKITPW